MPITARILINIQTILFNFLPFLDNNMFQKLMNFNEYNF